MSRLTSAQIIAQGHYLDPDFEPGSLTVSQLLGVLGYHNIVYPTPYSKPKLIALFDAEIKSRASKFKKERLKAEASIASDDGITDGHTGEPLAAARKAAPVRRSSRRLSRAPSEDVEEEPPRPDPPKRRRSSAQPNLGGPSRKIEPVEPVLVEESEPEEEEEELPVRKIGRSKKTAQAAGQQGRRASHAEDSGWEDNNVFQSGAESSSPARPRAKTTRKSVGPRKTRKSVSAPPEVLPSSSPLGVKDEPMYSPPQSKFEPQLPPSVTRETRLLAPKFNQPAFVLPTSPKQEQDETLDIGGDTDFADDGPTEDYGGDDGGLEDEEAEEEEEEDHNAVIARRIAEGGNQIALRPPPAERLSTAGVLIRVLMALLALATSGVVVNYKLESAPIGYCAAGRDTNPTLDALRARRVAVEACNAENHTLLPDGTPCPLPALPGVPHPDACTPCPAHATCSQFRVEKCDTGYLLKSHPLLFFLPPPAGSKPHSGDTVDTMWQVIGNVTDGLPGFGSVGLPPRCVEDPERKLRIGALGRAVELELGAMHGRRKCAPRPPSLYANEGGEARRWGDDIDTLKNLMRQKATPMKNREKLLANFEHDYQEAIQQLSEWGGIIIEEDARSGKRYIAVKEPHLSWDCAIRIKLRNTWKQWQATVCGKLGSASSDHVCPDPGLLTEWVYAGLFVLFVGGLYTRYQRAQGRVEAARVAGLVQTALDTLRAQERAYHVDPLSASAPYLSSLQLRDVVLAEEHSVPARARLWAKVERVVEGNANVRANLEEVGGGDEMRVWRWVGAPSPTKGRISNE
ncbi:Inner nuclear membrane protein SRC1 [Mycena venus]|uniref:Inner nuclear membrane protein SRC1 n=1 Tax=Mycena venus TaxID=2733690 RepID=A0A8H6XBN1_9AGAR|nr:Inner nuclear membrane protein SRC1 [Mycena venus]